MKRVILGIATGVIGIALCFYMFSQGAETKPFDIIENTTIQPAPVDEQAAYLADVTREINKVGLSKLYIVKCSSCHGRDGKGPVGSSIAGKSKEYNLSALMKYKNGQQKNSMMKGLLEKTSESDLEKLADEISVFK